MKKLSMIFAMLVLFASVSMAQTNKTETVRFARGESSAMLTRTIPANGSITFVINARAGQTMGFTVGYDFKDSDIVASLVPPGTTNVTWSGGPKEPNEYEIQDTGNHKLKVKKTKRKPITITLNLKIM